MDPDPYAGRQPAPYVAGGAAGCTGLATRRTVTHDGSTRALEYFPLAASTVLNAFVGKNRCLVFGRRLLTSRWSPLSHRPGSTMWSSICSMARPPRRSFRDWCASDCADRRCAHCASAIRNVRRRRSRALDLGAQGVIVPNVDDDVAAAAVVRAVRYPPDGDRSIGRLQADNIDPLCFVDGRVEKCDAGIATDAGPTRDRWDLCRPGGSVLVARLYPNPCRPDVRFGD